MTTIVAVSDTHELHRQLVLPDADILIHCGDWTYEGSPKAYDDCFDWLKEQAPRYKSVIVIMGNHDRNHQYFVNLLKEANILNIHYLENSSIELEGIKFYGCPNVSKLPRWAFDDHTDPTCWSRIPDDVEVLISHSPPQCILDELWQYGSYQLRLRVDDLMNKNLKVNIFGHCHDDGGKQLKLPNSSGREVLFVNCASCDVGYKIANSPMMFEV